MGTRNELLWEYYRSVMYATCPEDVFGRLEGADQEGMLSCLESARATLSDTLDPAAYPDDLDERALANEARAVLKGLFASAKTKILSGTYGQKVKVVDGCFKVSTDLRDYILRSEVVAQGDVALIYIGHGSGSDDAYGRVVAKLAANPEDNVFLENEAVCLGIFKDEPGQQNRHLPMLLDRFKTGDGRLGLVLRHHEGYTLEEIRQRPKYINGIPSKHVAWMMNRGLSALGFAHLRGVVHCNLAPEHIMIRPQNHNMVLLDWTGAAHRRDQPFRFARDGFSPPEVEDKRLPLPSSDIYAFGKCMIYALGGDPMTGEMPSSVEPGLRDFLRGFILESPIQRPDDAWKLHRRLSVLRKQWWGPDKFLEFIV